MGRFWLVVAACACLALPAYAQGNNVGQNGRGQGRTTDAQTKPREIAPIEHLSSIDVHLRAIARSLDAHIAESQSPAEQSRAERDVNAQERMADWGEAMLFIGFAEILITATGVWLVRKTILESRAATEDDIRPYVQLFRAKLEVIPSNARYIVKIQNSGSTPTTFFKVFFVSKAVPRTPDGVKWEIPPESEFRIQQWNAIGGGDAVTVALYDPTLSQLCAAILAGPDDPTLFLLGKVQYGDIWGNTYETEFAYFARDVSRTFTGNTQTGVHVTPRKMSRATGELRTFKCITKTYPP